MAYAYRRAEIVAGGGSVAKFDEWLAGPLGGWEAADKRLLRAINAA